MKSRLIVALALVMLVLPMTGAVAQNDTLVMRSIGNVSTFNPLFWTDSGSFVAVSLIWPYPFAVDRDTGIPQPGLTSWTISDDSLTYTFTIRDDANWSDGTPITSNDFKFTYDAAAAESVASARASNVVRFKEVNIIDDKTYEVVLKEPNCAIMQDFYSVNILPAHRFEADFSDISTNVLNTNPDISGGPYILEENIPDEYNRYRANPTYWGGEPEIPYVINRVITDPVISAQAVSSGEVDYDGFAPDEFEQIPSLDALNYESVSSDNTQFLMLNWADPNDPQPAYDENGDPVEQTPHPIFSDIRVRQAVAMGYDKSAILETLGEGGGALLVGSVVPAMGWAFNDDLEPWPYDPERAAQLLDEAGWLMNESTGIREKDGKPLAFELVYSPVGETFDTTALVAQDQLSQLGMDITITSLEWAAYLNDRLLAQKFDATIVGWGGSPPPDPTSTEPMMLSKNDIPGGGFNVISYVNPEFDELWAEGRSVAGCSVEERGKIYREIQRIQHDEVVMDFTITANTFHVMNKRVTGFDPGPWWNQWLTISELGFGG